LDITKHLILLFFIDWLAQVWGRDDKRSLHKYKIIGSEVHKYFRVYGLQIVDGPKLQYHCYKGDEAVMNLRQLCFHFKWWFWLVQLGLVTLSLTLLAYSISITCQNIGDIISSLLHILCKQVCWVYVLCKRTYNMQ